MPNTPTLIRDWPGPSDSTSKATIDSLLYAVDVLDQRTGLQNTSGIVTNVVRVVTAAGPITVTDADWTVVVNKTVAAASAVALPAGVTGREFIIKDGKGDANSNNITITPAAGTIDGGATRVISAAYGSVNLLYNGTEWNVI